MEAAEATTAKTVSKTVKKVKKAGKTTSGKALAFFPLAFLAWDYYSTRSFCSSFINVSRDFMWPAAVVVAKSVNASPF